MRLSDKFNNYYLEDKFNIYLLFRGSRGILGKHVGNVRKRPISSGSGQ